MGTITSALKGLAPKSAQIRLFTSPTSSGALAQAGQISSLLGQVIPFPPFAPTHPHFLFQLFPLEHLFLLSSNQIQTPQVVLHPLLFPPGFFSLPEAQNAFLWVPGPGTSRQALPWEGGRVGDFYSRRAKADRWAAEITLEGCWRGASGERGRRHLHGTDTPLGSSCVWNVCLLDGIRTHWILKNELKILFFWLDTYFCPSLKLPLSFFPNI